LRYEIREISSPGGESRFEMDLDDPPAEGDVIDPGTMVYNGPLPVVGARSSRRTDE
jgi:hypothetical protein